MLSMSISILDGDYQATVEVALESNMDPPSVSIGISLEISVIEGEW